MDDAEKKLAEVYTKAGVDLPELKDTPKEDSEEKSEEPKAKEEEKSDSEDTKTEHLQDQPKEQRKRSTDEPEKPVSIYDRYKDEKTSRKNAETRAEQAEQERDELARKLEAAERAKGTEEAKDTAEDAIAYAKEVGADPNLVKRIIEDARKGFESKTDPDVVKRLERFEQWEKSNAKTIEAQLFNDEFTNTVPTLKRLFPTVNDDELKSVKSELDKLSHTKEWHDKSLGYIAFENQETLSKLISPKKRGMEVKGRGDVEHVEMEFDPNADLSSMTPKQRGDWEKQYKSLTKSEIITNEHGKKLIV